MYSPLQSVPPLSTISIASYSKVLKVLLTADTVMSGVADICEAGTHIRTMVKPLGEVIRDCGTNKTALLPIVWALGNTKCFFKVKGNFA